MTHMGSQDCMTSVDSTAVYGEPELNKLLGYVGHIETVGGNYGYSACAVGKPSVLYPIERSSWTSQVV